MLIPILTMSIIGLLFGLGLAFASRIFKVDVDPRIERILAALPGVNCGACGRPGCAGLAEAIAKGEAGLSSCPPGGQEVYNKIAEIFGVEKEALEKRVARIRCGGGNKAKDKFIYKGVRTCAAANLIAMGQKLCRFGCLGFGDCVSVCPFDAIHMGRDGIPVVDSATCTACARCVKACPKDIISLEVAEERYYVKCLSQDKISVVKNACSVGCIGCKICEKLSKGAFVVENNLSRLDYSKVDEAASLKECVEKCPTKCIVEI
jgi:electron transport complex protein RnfB